MRLLLVALAVALLSVPAFAQQAPVPSPMAPPLRVLEDAAGDYDVAANGQAIADAHGSAADLRSLDVHETQTSYVFDLAVAALPSSAGTIADSVEYTISFAAGGEPYCVPIFFDAEELRAFAGIGQIEPDFGFCDGRESVGITFDQAAGAFSLVIPRDAVLDAQGSALFKGEQLDGFIVEAQAFTGRVAESFTEGTVTAEDRMPNANAGTVPWPVQHAALQSGSVRASSPHPIRVSNGEATTLLFELLVRNDADHKDVVALSANGTPEGWTITFPQAELRIDAKGDMTVPVLVTVPFVHDHGRLVAFAVRAQSRSDPLSFAEVELGVRYTKVPQPAGHHDTVFLHEAGNRYYMNTLETDEIPAGEETGGPQFGGGCSTSGGGESAQTEVVSLVPGFDLGLDVDLARQGTARITLSSQLPVMGGYSVSGFFLAWYGDERPDTCMRSPDETTFAVINRSAPLNIDANSSTTVELPITPLPYGDFLPHRPDINMALLLVLFSEGLADIPFCCIGVESPQYEAGSWFQLPLNEYHDPVRDYFSTLAGVDLLSEGGQQRLVNPGETAVFELSMQNVGAEAASFDLEMTGTNLAWARILGDASIRLGAGESRTLAVAVSPPADAADGDLVDVTLHAVKADDANVRSLIRLLAEVDTDADHPDDSAAAGELDKELRGKKAPGLALALAAVALAAAAIALRRRQPPS